ncbi:hypothetical protein PO002_40835 [Cupriavidus necator]|uniref:hypothetical protein n=1 Tax=Cupriavidus necator TaxID=106590 RepID=UPI0039C40B6D
MNMLISLHKVRRSVTISRLIVIAVGCGAALRVMLKNSPDAVSYTSFAWRPSALA